jgi:CRP/FNR family cyclic AMP-dependent transcriptional regulator
METLNRRVTQSTSQTIYASNPRPREASRAISNRRQVFQPKQHNIAVARPGSGGGEGYQKIRNRLISCGIPESILNELLEQPTIVNYKRGAFIFLQGAPADLFFWVSGGLVDILCPGPDGEETYASVLGPGDFFGFVECTDHKGRPAQAFQARARTNAQVGLLVREHVYKVLRRQDPALLIQILLKVVAALSETTLHYAQFLRKNYHCRLETVLADLASKFGVKESRGIFLIPEFAHSDFAEMIGCSRPMVSRLIAEMISVGSLIQNGKHYIIADEQLAVEPRQLGLARA